jgi:hypothetical protein
VSLQSRLTAFIQAVGADIKALNGKVDSAVGSTGFRHLAVSAPASASGWRTIPVSAAVEVNPAGTFTRNADGSVTIRDAGWYSVSSTFRNAAASGVAVCTFALTDTLNNIGTPFVIDVKSLGGNYSNELGSDSYFAAGAKVYPNVWTDISAPIELTYFTIARLGGMKGDPGPVGPQGTVLLFEQPTEPVTDVIGAIWIKGD